MSKITGRADRRKKRQQKESPIGQDLENNNKLQEPSEKITLVEKVDCEDEEERYWAIGSLSRLILEDSTVFAHVIEKTNLLEKLTKRIHDPHMNVRVAASGTIRNITAIADKAICERIVSFDTLNAIFPIINDKSEYEAENKVYFDQLLVNVLATLSNMSELSEPIFNKITNLNIINRLFELLGSSNPEVIYGSAELLNVLTEDYDSEAKFFTQDHFNLLKTLMENQSRELNIRTMAVSILFNIIKPEDVDNFLAVALPTLLTSLDFDSKSLFTKLNAPPINQYLVEGNPDSNTKEMLDTWQTCFQAQSTSLEIITNITVGTELNADEMETDEETLSPKIIQLFKTSNVLNKVLSLCQFLDQDTENALMPIKYLATYFNWYEMLKMRSLSCVNNIIFSFPVEDLGDINILWNFMFSICIQILPSNRDIEQKITITTILYTLLRKTKQEPTIQQIEAIFQMNTHENEQIRTNAIGMIGCLLKRKTAQPIIEKIAIALINALGDPSGWVIAESLDYIFSNFDDYHNEIVAKLGLVQKLKEFIPLLNQKLSSVSDEESILYSRLDEAAENLPMFIKYKEEQKF